MHYFKRYYNLQCTLPQRVPRGLHPPAASDNSAGFSLPQRVPRGLHQRPATTPNGKSSLPQRVPRGLHLHQPLCSVHRHLCLSVYHGDCIMVQIKKPPKEGSLPQRVPRGLHLQFDCIIFCIYRLCLSVYHGDCIRGVGRYRADNTLCLSVYHGDCIGKNEQTRNTIIV